jgi:hypothetical protein
MKVSRRSLCATAERNLLYFLLVTGTCVPVLFQRRLVPYPNCDFWLNRIRINESGSENKAVRNQIIC